PDSLLVLLCAISGFFISPAPPGPLNNAVVHEPVEIFPRHPDRLNSYCYSKHLRTPSERGGFAHVGRT
ncbi:MAG: hypothetical protein ACODAD_16165, partial [Planctomycetota bacterium]